MQQGTSTNACLQRADREPRRSRPQATAFSRRSRPHAGLGAHHRTTGCSSDHRLRDPPRHPGQVSASRYSRTNSPKKPASPREPTRRLSTGPTPAETALKPARASKRMLSQPRSRAALSTYGVHPTEQILSDGKQGKVNEQRSENQGTKTDAGDASQESAGTVIAEPSSSAPMIGLARLSVPETNRPSASRTDARARMREKRNPWTPLS